MELFSLIIKLAAELAKLARTLLTDGMRFMASLARSRTALAAENLFLRKQLAFYQERKIRPRRFDNVTRFMLVLLSHGFAIAREVCGFLNEKKLNDGFRCKRSFNLL